ncbi:unnamed protein product [Cyclocybe aegerita]|uniref:Major facilitator superfamily (MFS) profile domain-containing protein n=1 Tax=Cyclocybe aegerita TaxID=1973307 RepID=A0A8S0WT61_CYCAE|nr:unnamed protein product [Cyclocybe aegerita]
MRVLKGFEGGYRYEVARSSVQGEGCQLISSYPHPPSPTSLLRDAMSAENTTVFIAERFTTTDSNMNLTTARLTISLRARCHIREQPVFYLRKTGKWHRSPSSAFMEGCQIGVELHTCSRRLDILPTSNILARFLLPNFSNIGVPTDICTPSAHRQWAIVLHLLSNTPVPTCNACSYAPGPSAPAPKSKDSPQDLSSTLASISKLTDFIRRNDLKLSICARECNICARECNICARECNICKWCDYQTTTNPISADLASTSTPTPTSNASTSSTSITRKRQPPRPRLRRYVVGSFACIGGGLFGLDISSMSGVLNNHSYLSTFGFPGPSAQGAIVASMPAGSLIGALSVTQLADRIGRKRTIILAGIIWVIGSILQCAAVNRGMLVVGRIVSGMSVGLSSAVVPIYQSEITAPSIRGRMVSLQQWSITWGILIQYFIQFGCSYIDGVASFRIPWGLQMIPAIVLSAGMTVFPESPRFLFDHGHEDDALQVLADLHGGGDKNHELVVLEYEEIKQQGRKGAESPDEKHSAEA